MLIQASPPLHLTYCLNIHPGESWPEAFDAIKNHALRIRDMLARGGAFGLGLRLSAQAAAHLADSRTLAEFRDFLKRENLYVFTINGFPYGQFHAAAVKENVYRPDWEDRRRRDYTIQLADILAAILPEGVPGSISTVPCSYKAWIDSTRQVAAMAAALAGAAAHLAEIKNRTGSDICLALEPEPDCFLAKTADVLAFFAGPLRERGGQECIRQHIGVCVDTAHCAVEFESPADSIRKLQQAGIRIAKVQLSAALRAAATEESLRRLGEFCDEVYLHQVKIRGRGGAVRSFRDLPDALALYQCSNGGWPVRVAPEERTRLASKPWHPQIRSDRAPADGGEIRVHFHVPLFWEPTGPAGAVGSTADLLDDDFFSLLRAGASGNLEIETYTFDVLPADIRSADVAESIAAEYRWVLNQL